MSVLAYRYRDHSQRFPKRTTWLHLTASFGLLYLSEALLSHLESSSGTSVDSKDDYGRTPLLLAAQGGHNTVVELLLTSDSVNPDSEDDGGRTPLSWAAEKGHDTVVKLLFAMDGVDPNFEDCNGRNLTSWVGQADYEFNQLLYMFRPNLQANTFHYTPLNMVKYRL
jgi:Ankyrin repeats (3 copies)